MRKINNLKILCLFIMCFMLNGCALYTMYGGYEYNKKDDSVDEEIKISYFGGPFIYEYSKGKINHMAFYFNTTNEIGGCAAFLFLPILCQPTKHIKIENNENDLRIEIDSINGIKYNKILHNFTEEEIRELRFYLIKNDIIYKSEIIIPECKKYRNEKTGCYYNESIKYIFPIKIKDIGKEGATLIVEYKGIRKEMPFKYGYSWTWR